MVRNSNVCLTRTPTTDQRKFWSYHHIFKCSLNVDCVAPVVLLFYSQVEASRPFSSFSSLDEWRLIWHSNYSAHYRTRKTFISLHRDSTSTSTQEGCHGSIALCGRNSHSSMLLRSRVEFEMPAQPRVTGVDSSCPCLFGLVGRESIEIPSSQRSVHLLL